MIRLAVGLRSTTQSVALLGIETGTFSAAGVDVACAAMEVAGPRAAAGLEDGLWDVAEFGAVPVAQAVAAGGDLAIVASVEPHSALYLVGGRSVATPDRLAGKCVGVLSTGGQTGVLARKIIATWGLSSVVEIRALRTYPAIYEAIRADEIAAGVLSVDYAIDGETQFGLHRLIDLADRFAIQGPCVVTTRKLLCTRPDEITRYLRGYVAAIRIFKRNPDVAIPFLARHLGFAAAPTRKIYLFYAERFQTWPMPSEIGLSNAIAETAEPGASLTPAGLCDLTVLQALRHSLSTAKENPDGSRSHG